jgi:hypothetical protein
MKKREKVEVKKQQQKLKLGMISILKKQQQKLKFGMIPIPI